MTPFMSQRYQDATCLPESITLAFVHMPIPSSTIPPVFKVPLHIPSFSSVSYPTHENASALSPSSLRVTTVDVSSIETSISDNPSTPEVTVTQSGTST